MLQAKESAGKGTWRGNAAHTSCGARRHGVPDIELTHFAERYATVKDIMAATFLLIMVDADDGYGNKKVVPVEVMVNKIKAAIDAKSSSDFFVLARTDSINPEGLESVIERGEACLKAGADGIYVEGPETEKELEAIGQAFNGTPLATSILENGGKMPWLSPKDFGAMGFSMILYPTTLLFRATYAFREAAKELRAGKEIKKDLAVDMSTFEKIVELEHWQQIEKRFPVATE